MYLMKGFETIIFSSLIGSLIVLTILSIKTIFKDKLPPSFHYYIWIILFIKLILPTELNQSLNVSKTNENTYQPIIISSKENTNKNLNSTISITTPKSLDKNPSNTSINIFIKNKTNIEKYLCFIWLSGLILHLVILIIGYKKLKKIIKFSSSELTVNHKEILYNCKSIMSINSNVKLLYSNKISTPSLCGLINPKILLPMNVSHNIDNEELKHILLHELSHLKHKDTLINWIITFLSAVYFFNPILIYGFNKMKQDCEIFCDNCVMSKLTEGENFRYGNTIIKVLNLIKKNKVLLGTTSMITNNSGIKRRIFMISKYKKTTLASILLGVVGVIIVSILSVKLNTSKINLSEKTLKPASVATTSTNILSKEIKNISTSSVEPLTPFSSDIVVYNSHADESYPSGKNLTDIGALINDKLVKEGLNSKFIKCGIVEEYPKAYHYTRDIITKNVKNYNNTMLLDIHRDGNMDEHSKKSFVFVLAKESPYYNSNKKLTYSLIKEIKRISANKIPVTIQEFNKGSLYFNQDLSKNSALINLGSVYSSDDDVNECVNILVESLKNVINNT